MDEVEDDIAERISTLLKSNGSFDEWRDLIRARLEEQNALQSLTAVTTNVIRSHEHVTDHRISLLERTLTNVVAESDVPSMIETIIERALLEPTFVKNVQAAVREQLRALPDESETLKTSPMEAEPPPVDSKPPSAVEATQTVAASPEPIEGRFGQLLSTTHQEHHDLASVKPSRGPSLGEHPTAHGTKAPAAPKTFQDFYLMNLRLVFGDNVMGETDVDQDVHKAKRSRIGPDGSSSTSVPAGPVTDSDSSSDSDSSIDGTSSSSSSGSSSGDDD
uniref:Uncharacterized protein n=1 Tax=Eutreptiella gymnastica TaxID=73025 RepID=A0A7S1J9I8_9EUGL|mmetsp:Transcript_75718/g.133824  ORF Transcript_75718/g.133824 Transcript_75718/m.133824 type:complete len:276 (+) Transcript_75718:37-864(+)